jgi:hypothetical protein
VVQIHKQVPGDFLYRLIPASGTGSAPAPLPAADAQSGIVALPLPAGMQAAGTTLEVQDADRGNIAEIPLSATAPAEITEASFNRIQTVTVPVQSHGKGVIGVDVAMTTTDPHAKFSQDLVLQPADQGVATFRNVPLGMPVTLTVKFGANPPQSETKTITRDHPADGYHWSAVQVDWPDVRTVAAPAVAPPTAPAAAPASQAPAANAPQPESGGGIFGNIVSLVLLGGICYGIWWLYTNNRIKPMLDKLGVTAEPAGAADTQAPSPFASSKTTPLTPITEGTADPFGGGIVGTATSYSAPSAGPRLVGSVGTYAGSIFPLGASSTEIGRDEANPVALPQDTHTSRRHALITAAGGQYQIVDNGSANGTYLNGVRIPAQNPQPLRSGDELQIGQTRFRFEL